ncbi:MAG TPA: CRISPR-associated endonuclease Cas2 [Firmicutes bacterium]|nr:CRISPR-associated endonuclease Cas2 [Bacillota bacterium]
METLVIYDIVDDRLRYKVAEACKDYGLERIQYSAFRGYLTHNRLEELQKRLKRVLGKAKGNIQFYPICEKDMALSRQIGQSLSYPEFEEEPLAISEDGMSPITPSSAQSRPVRFPTKGVRVAEDSVTPGGSRK